MDYKYRANLDGIKPLDIIKCEDGNMIEVTNILHKEHATGYFKYGHPFGCVSIKHSETNNNCWKFYKSK